MRYGYKCQKCGHSETVEKKMMDSSREEKCSKCKEITSRVYTAPSINTNDGNKQ